MSVIVAKA